jgi:uncharacterized protein (DUF302 family)
MNINLRCALLPLLILVTACGADAPVGPERYVETDAMVATIRSNIAGSERLSEVVVIDHSRLGHEAGSPMPPSRVVLFSDPQLESELIAQNPLTALDLPLRLLAYEAHAGERSRLIYNSFDYLVSRYDLDETANGTQRKAYEQAMSLAMRNIDQGALAAFGDDSMKPDGIITISSPFGFEETLARVNAAIDAQDDTVRFGVVDFQANAARQGITLDHAYMILFGGPGPGGKAMADAVTLGLDAFCQKFLIWADPQGNVHLSFNDLLDLAERQDVPKRLPLRVINFRLDKVFSEALAGDDT